MVLVLINPLYITDIGGEKSKNLENLEGLALSLANWYFMLCLYIQYCFNCFDSAINTNEPFGFGRFATDYSTASRSRVTHNNFWKLVSISLTIAVTIHLILEFINNHNIEINLNYKYVHTAFIVIQFETGKTNKHTHIHTHTHTRRSMSLYAGFLSLYPKVSLEPGL